MRLENITSFLVQCSYQGPLRVMSRDPCINKSRQLSFCSITRVCPADGGLTSPLAMGTNVIFYWLDLGIGCLRVMLRGDLT